VTLNRANLNVANRANLNIANRAAVNLNQAHVHLGNNNVFAAPNGNVYRHTPQGAWEQHTNRVWGAAPAAMQQRLNLESRARVIGNMRANTGYVPRMPANVGGYRRR
jgi:hypothetical protein